MAGTITKDSELTAMAKIEKIIGPFDTDAQRRIIKWFDDRLKKNPEAEPQPVHSTSGTSGSSTARRAGSS